MSLIDIGVNLTNRRLRPHTAQILEKCSHAGVETLIVTGTNLEHSQAAIELCQEFPDRLYCTCGVHPHDASSWSPEVANTILELARSPMVKAIGETGLDYNRMFSPRQEQIEAFEWQLDLASQTGKPAFLHQRDAMEDFIAILKQFRGKLENVVVHCFTDDRQSLRQLLDLDCHIGITGWICDERRGQSLQQAVIDIPANRLMLETDAPYLLPRDLDPKPADKTNYPYYLPHILNTVAHHQNREASRLKKEIITTTREFFNIS